MKDCQNNEHFKPCRRKQLCDNNCGAYTCAPNFAYHVCVAKTEVAEMLQTLREGCWIGEEGGAACIAQTKRQGLFKIKALMRRDCGEAEARAVKLADIDVGWARLATQEEKDETWSEFFVMYKEKTPYKCYVLRV